MRRTPPSILAALEARREQGALRTLPAPVDGVDFCSNDYLGLATRHLLLNTRHPEATRDRDWEHEACRERLTNDRDSSWPRDDCKVMGSTGSRLISGNSEQFELFEERIAQFHHGEAALLFNSGYDANLGLLSSLAQRGATIVYDELCHASIRDGLRMGFAKTASFRHQDLQDAEEKLSLARGDIYLVVESVYSMDGDLAPLDHFCELAEKWNAYLIVDEAHAVGVFGERGEGLATPFADRIFARLYTFGKALGAHGAAIVGSEDLRSYLINFARSFIYTTAMDHSSVQKSISAYDFLEMSPDSKQLREKLHALIAYTARILKETFGDRALATPSAIQGLLIAGNERVQAAADLAQRDGYVVKAIKSPTVPAGQERLRICLHAFNTDSEVAGLCQVLKGFLSG